MTTPLTAKKATNFPFVMVKIYLKNINDISVNELNVSKLSPYRREKFERLIDKKSKLQSLAAGLMLSEFISCKEIKINEYGKPGVQGAPFFNIAHSGDYVALALSNKAEVGCDIEQLREIDYERTGRCVYTENELDELKSAEDKRDKFYEFWTKKEAYIKCIGKGFHFPVKSLDLSKKKAFELYEGKKLFFKEYMLSGYKIMLCSSDNDFEEKIDLL